MTIKTDNEAALKALVVKVIEKVRASSSDKVDVASKIEEAQVIATEHPAPYESQSNGATEVGVCLVRAPFRTLKLCLGTGSARTYHPTIQ
jgi:hypothetical protein